MMNLNLSSLVRPLMKTQIYLSHHLKPHCICKIINGIYDAYLIYYLVVCEVSPANNPSLSSLLLQY